MAPPPVVQGTCNVTASWPLLLKTSCFLFYSLDRRYLFHGLTGNVWRCEAAGEKWAVKPITASFSGHRELKACLELDFKVYCLAFHLCVACEKNLLV